MHYFQFNIGDYTSHTAHLDPMEDIIYRRLMDVYYRDETPLPDDVKDLARLIRMREECERIAGVLREFFELRDGSWRSKRIDDEIDKFKSKSAKAKKSAETRWQRKADKGDANALQTQTEGNANHEPITTNQEPVTKKKTKTQPSHFIPPTAEDVRGYAAEKGLALDVDKYLDHYTANGWKAGANKVKDWKATVRNWVRRQTEFGGSNGSHQRPSQRPSAGQTIDMLIDNLDKSAGGLG